MVKGYLAAKHVRQVYKNLLETDLQEISILIL
jgi:hypothetical protein